MLTISNYMCSWLNISNALATLLVPWLMMKLIYYYMYL